MKTLSFLPDRIVKKVGVDPETGCWIWTASRTRLGYGQVWWDNRMVEAHQVVYRLLVGEVPNGLELDHLCGVRSCVNPDHLEPVTHQENCRRGRGGEYWASKTHCPQGHKYAGDNLVVVVRKNGSKSRQCRACGVEAVRRYRARKAMEGN